MLPHFTRLIVLTAHANAAIRGICGPEPLARHPVFNGYRWLLFAEKGEAGGAPKILCATPDLWIADLVARHALRVRIRRFPTQYPTSDRISAASLGGGGEWIMEAMFPYAKSELWTTGEPLPENIRPDPAGSASLSDWVARLAASFQSPQPAENCLTWWRYDVVESETAEPAPPLGEAHAGFAKALEDIEAFAEAQAPEWKANFSRALAALTSPMPEVPELNPVRPIYRYAPEGALPLPARQILQAAMIAWVFGGMGSWNDIWCETQGLHREYERISDAMYQALCDAVVSAANWMPCART